MLGGRLRQTNVVVPDTVIFAVKPENGASLERAKATHYNLRLLLVIIIKRKEGDGRKHQESIRESYCDRDSKDLHTGICANPQKGAWCVNRMIDLCD